LRRERIVPTSHSETTLTSAYDNALVKIAAPPGNRRTPIFIIASPRPRTGKTFLARLLVDYCRLDGGKVKAFDLNPGAYELAVSRPSVTVRSDLSTTPDQVALFDPLVVNDGTAKVVDIGYTSFERFFALCEEIGFFNEARRREFEVVILFAAEANPVAAMIYEQLRRRFAQAIVVAVLNEGILNGRNIREHYRFARAAEMPLQIPLLSLALKAYAGRTDGAFTHFEAKAPAAVPMGQAFELRAWTKQAFVTFREFELRLLLDKLQASLRS
jgi:hypothetical protein